MRKIGICLFICFVFWGQATTAFASIGDSVKSMAEQSEQFFKYVKAEDWIEAREALWQLTAAFSEHNWEDSDVSVEGIHALSGTLIQAKQALTSAQLDTNKIQQEAIRVRLGIDALQNREQPLWHHYFNVLKKDLSHLREVLSSGNKTDIEQGVERLRAHYMMIEPALYVTRSAEVVEQVRSLFDFMDRQIHDVSVNRRQLQEAVDQWDQLLIPLFYGSDEEVLAVSATPFTPIMYTTWLLAILIGAVLTYVVWRKAQAPQRIPFHRR